MQLQVARALPVLCVKFHEDVQALSARFLAEQRRHYYVTPTSYLELLGSYKKLLAKRQDEVRAGPLCSCGVHSQSHPLQRGHAMLDVQCIAGVGMAAAASMSMLSQCALA